jgi:hypothetical protein
LNQSYNRALLLDLKCPEPVRHSSFYDWKRFLKPFRHGGFVKFMEEKDVLIT